MKTALTFVLGFGSGWAIRSLAESPEGVGVKLLEVAHQAKEHFEKWASAERERLSDIFAEAQAKAEERTRSRGAQSHH